MGLCGRVEEGKLVPSGDCHCRKHLGSILSWKQSIVEIRGEQDGKRRFCAFKLASTLVDNDRFGTLFRSEI